MRQYSHSVSFVARRGTLKHRAERWPEVAVHPDLLRTLELVHALRSTPARAAGKPLSPWSRATALVTLMGGASPVGVKSCVKQPRVGADRTGIDPNRAVRIDLDRSNST